MLIAVLNQSSVVSNESIKQMVKAVNKQMTLHTAPAWNQLPPTITFYEDAVSVPGYAWVVRMMDTPEQAIELKYSYKMNGKVTGFVFCKNALDNKSALFSEDSKTSICSLLSKEVCEMLVDRFASQWASGIVSEFGSEYACDICTPVENDVYTIEVATDTESGYFKVVNGKIIKNESNTLVCSVSNFVFPSWFNTEARANNFPYDYLKVLPASFKMSEGSSLTMRGGLVAGTINYVFSAATPEWKKELKNKFGRRNF